MTTRRDVLRLLGLGIAGSALLPAIACATERDENGMALPPTDTSSARIERIGLQLYTVRRALGADLEGTIAAVAAAGVTELEFAGYYDKPASWWNDIMKRHNLTAPSTHIALPATDAAWAPHFERSVAMGHKYVFVPWIGNDYRSADGWKRLADRLNAGGELAKKSGLRMGYHNHDFEFAPLPSGSNGLETLLTGTDASLVDFELDLYWAVKADAAAEILEAIHLLSCEGCWSAARARDAGRRRRHDRFQNDTREREDARPAALVHRARQSR